jgi:hypothetical protein
LQTPHKAASGRKGLFGLVANSPAAPSQNEPAAQDAKTEQRLAGAISLGAAISPIPISLHRALDAAEAEG